MFEISRENTRRCWTIPLAMLGELSLVTFLVSMPMMQVPASPASASRLILFAPPSPPPPLPPARGRQEPLKSMPRRTEPAKLTAPAKTPLIANETKPVINEAPEIAGVSGGVLAGVEDGVLGGIPGGVLGSVVNSLPSMAPPPSPIAAAPSRPVAPSRVSVGGNVQAGLLLRQVTPAYPPLAKEGHIVGTVRLKAVIGCDGKVKDLTLISGHPLLIKAAESAVMKWLYKPTLLNGLPVEVETEIYVVFSLVA